MLSGKAKVNGYAGLWDVIIYKAKSFALTDRVLVLIVQLLPPKTFRKISRLSGFALPNWLKGQVGLIGTGAQAGNELSPGIYLDLC